MALENARHYETARNLADRDPLTGFYNHRYLHERLAEEVVRAVRSRLALSVVMLDLDDFKLVNDTFGHVYGDRVLVHVADLIRSTLRGSDVAARYGGDEFALILPETGRDEAMVVAERILDAFRDSPAGRGGAPAVPDRGVDRHRHPPGGRPHGDRADRGRRPGPLRREGEWRQPRAPRGGRGARGRPSRGPVPMGDGGSPQPGPSPGLSRGLGWGPGAPDPVRKYRVRAPEGTGPPACLLGTRPHALDSG